MNYLIKVNNSGYSNVTKEITLQSEPFIGEHDKFHYCYEVYIPSTGWIYRGSRSCKDWSTDKYLGSPSYYSYKDDVNMSRQVQFTILSFHETRKDANIEEIHITSKEFVLRDNVYNQRSAGGCATYNCAPVKDYRDKWLSPIL